ncbi:TerD family protein [Angustibacter speluncae]
MTGVALRKGENTSLPEDVSTVKVVVGWSEADGEPHDVDGAALLLTEAGRVRSDADFVFYNQPSAADGAVQHLGRAVTDGGRQEAVGLDLEAIPDDIHVLAVTASLTAGTFGDLHGLYLSLSDQAGQPIASFMIDDASSETAFLFGEIYRRNGSWKLRAVGQGWASGLAGLATDFGVTVDDSPEDDESPQHREDAPEAPATATESFSEDSVSEVPAPDEVAHARLEPSSSIVTASPARRRRGVRTVKAPARQAATRPVSKLADDPNWQMARLFSVSGVGSADEQEKRATSALLSTMLSVKPFARAICARLGAPAGNVETFLEVQFAKGEGKVVPDGVLRVVRGQRRWTALLEVKTGTGQLRAEQVENYVDVARTQGFDVVVTLSNEIAPSAGDHPVVVDQRKLKKVALHHLSWAEVLHEARMVHQHQGVPDATQHWILSELIRYLEHPKSGAAGFDDMGASWVPVREAVAAGTLRPSDRKVPAVAHSWQRLVRHLMLRLSADLGVTVTEPTRRGSRVDAASRSQDLVTGLATEGRLPATLRVPGAAGALDIVADLRTTRVRVGTAVAAPQEGTSHRRVQWILRQLREAPDDVLVEVQFARHSETTCEQLKDLREGPGPLLAGQTKDVAGFVLSRTYPLGTKRSGVKGAFIPSVTDAVESFYSLVLQPLQAWVPSAPKLSDDSVEDVPAVLDPDV